MVTTTANNGGDGKGDGGGGGGGDGDSVHAVTARSFGAVRKLDPKEESRTAVLPPWIPLDGTFPFSAVCA